MSHYIVCPIRSPGQVQPDGSTVLVDRIAKDSSKRYWVDKDQAVRYAEELAKKHPQVAFAVLEPFTVIETAAPPPPKLIRKRINSNGELVLDKGE